MHIRKTIEELKLKVRTNIEQINHNQEQIKRLVKLINSEESEKKYKTYHDQNKELLEQNNDLINVQLTLMNFLEKYKDTAIVDEKIPVVDIYSITEIQEVFTLTIKNIIPFDKSHPYYSDKGFINKLIVYYKNLEDYERCHQLYMLMEKIEN